LQNIKQAQTMKKTTLLLFCLWATIAAKAQVITLHGKVIDRVTQKGIPYVNIGLPKLSIGTSANEEGAFILKIADKHLTDTLVFSSMGYHTRWHTCWLVKCFSLTRIILLDSVEFGKVKSKQRHPLSI
jgi:prepilin signal peptidase PulO-like enzyme (type II secretory pathway)